MPQAHPAGAHEPYRQCQRKSNSGNTVTPAVVTLCREWGEVVQDILARRADEGHGEPVKESGRRLYSSVR
jgi:hypothetical protein